MPAKRSPDEVAQALRTYCHDKNGFNLKRFKEVLQVNGIPPPNIVCGERGWHGRFRMCGGNSIRAVLKRKGSVKIGERTIIASPPAEKVLEPEALQKSLRPLELRRPLQNGGKFGKAERIEIQFNQGDRAFKAKIEFKSMTEPFRFALIASGARIYRQDWRPGLFYLDQNGVSKDRKGVIRYGKLVLLTVNKMIEFIRRHIHIELPAGDKRSPEARIRRYVRLFLSHSDHSDFPEMNVESLPAI